MRARRLLPFTLLAIASCGDPPPIAFEEPPAVARFVTASRVGTEPPIPGAMAAAAPGDVVLANDYLTVVIAAPAPERDPRLPAGSLLDAAPRGGVDVLHTLEPMAAAGGLRPVVRHLEPVPGGADHAEAVARGAFTGADSLILVQRYRLAAGERFVEIVSHVTNRGAEAVRLEVGDRVNWGRAEPLVADADPSEAPRRWFAGAGESTAYLWAADGEHRAATSGPGSHRLLAGARLLAPGDTLEVRRRWVVVHGSIAEAVHAMPGLVPGAGRIAVEVRDSEHLPVHGAIVEARDAGARLLIRGETNRSGLALLSVPPGVVTLEAMSADRGRRRNTVRVDSAHEARARLDLPEGARLRLRAVDPAGNAIPAEWRLRGLDDAPDPMLGPRHRTAGGAVLFAAPGDTAVRVPAGRYRVGAYSGVRRDQGEATVMLDPGATTEVTLVLPELPVPAEWVSLELHAHAGGTPGSVVDAGDRAAQHRAHGIAWTAFTDPAPVPGGASSGFPGARLGGAESVSAGHRIAWYAPGGEALPRPAIDPGAGLPARARAVRAAAPGAFVVVSASCAEDSLFVPSIEDLAAVDGWELWSGPRHRRWEKGWQRWMEALSSGTRLVATGAAATEGLASSADGLPVTLVRLPAGASVPGAAEQVLDALRAGRCQVTNGPFIDLSVDGAAPGDTLRARPGTLLARVRVVAPRGVDVRRIVLVVDGLEHASFMVRGSGRATRFDETVEFLLARSGFVLVRVEGNGAAGKDAPETDRRPLAFTNPVWLEISPDPR